MLCHGRARAAYNSVVSTMSLVTMYGSRLEAGRRSCARHLDASALLSDLQQVLEIPARDSQLVTQRTATTLAWSKSGSRWG